MSEGIEGIATRTNLLSLNASIEAARVGEAGRGMDEVAEGAGSVGGLVTTMRQNIHGLKELMSEKNVITCSMIDFLRQVKWLLGKQR